jgi:hypothetical protein
MWIKRHAVNHDALQHLMPLFNNIHSMFFHGFGDFTFIRNNFPAALFNVKVVRTNLYFPQHHPELELLCDWLCSRRADGEPRLLIAEDERLLRMVREVGNGQCTFFSYLN